MLGSERIRWQTETSLLCASCWENTIGQGDDRKVAIGVRILFVIVWGQKSTGHELAARPNNLAWERKIGCYDRFLLMANLDDEVVR